MLEYCIRDPFTGRVLGCDSTGVNVMIVGRLPYILFMGFFLLFAGFSATDPGLCAPGPLAVIQSGTDKALEILHSSQSGQAPALRARRGEILRIVDEYFNFHEMAKRALGRPWKDQSPQNQKEFVDLFKQLLFNSYVDKVEAYTGSNERVVYDAEKVEGEYALVKTRVLGYKNADVQVDYRLRAEEGIWKVYDVVVEGISLVNNYREQFSSILANESFDSLLKRMRGKLDEQSMA